MNPKLIVPTLTTLLPVYSATGAITVYAEYHLGETGSLGANNLPLDSSGNGRDMVNEISGSAATVASAGVYAANSTAYLSTAGGGNEGWYSSGLFNTLPTDNFAFGVFARAASVGAPEGDVFTVGGSNGSFKLSLAGNGWAASAHNVDWIAAANGVSGSFAADTWVHLALIRSGGATTFYINGAAQGSTYAGTPVHNTPHISVAPGGSSYFDGHIDEARVVTFTSGESAANILGTLQGVPEPSAALLGGVGLLGLLRRRRDS
ncbi:MAG: LamG domain-containing protein [Verrucomicrobia bacterium]|nr:LamG domain-containing protein [Verrucomicrobiota bacterium]